MKFEERSYRGKVFRPRPEIHLSPPGDLLIVATPWGPRAPARRLIQVIVDAISSARVDQESTSPFARLDCLSQMGNDLRGAVYLANDTLYREDNRDEYVSGLELLALGLNGQEITFVQIGQPNILMARPGLPLVPISVQVDSSADIILSNEVSPPLPGGILGLSSTSNFSVQTIRRRDGDKIVLLSRSFLSPRLFHLSSDEASDVTTLSSILAQDSPHSPFWLGVLSL